MSLAQNIRKFRKEKGWSQDDLASKLNIRRSKISSYELRNVQPKLNLLTEMARVLEVDLEELIGENSSDQAIQETTQPANESVSIGGATPQDDINVLKERILRLEDKIHQLYEIVKLKDELLSEKEKAIKRMQSSHSKDRDDQKTSIELSRINDKGQFINWKSIKISDDQYDEIAPGVLDRVLNKPEDLIFDWEDSFKPYMDKLNFEKDRIILSRASEGSSFPRHYHIEKETLYCAQGRFRENLSNRVISVGEQIAFEPFEHHELSFLEDTLIILSLQLR